MNLFVTHVESPLGKIAIFSNGTALTGLYFEGQKHFPADTSEWIRDASPALHTKTVDALSNYFVGCTDSFKLPLEPAGTLFQRRVWTELEAIPRGGTLAYSELAARLGTPSATRAIGSAVGRNPLSILIPCHRVIGRNGDLRGYAGGLTRKAALLKLEGAPLSLSYRVTV